MTNADIKKIADEINEVEALKILFHNSLLKNKEFEKLREYANRYSGRMDGMVDDIVSSYWFHDAECGTPHQFLVALEDLLYCDNGLWGKNIDELADEVVANGMN